MRLITLCAVALLLSGCSAGMKSDFTCKKIGGMEGCGSMTDIRDAMDRGEFTAAGQSPSASTPAPRHKLYPPCRAVTAPAALSAPPSGSKK